MALAFATPTYRLLTFTGRKSACFTAASKPTYGRRTLAFSPTRCLEVNTRISWCVALGPSSPTFFDCPCYVSSKPRNLVWVLNGQVSVPKGVDILADTDDCHDRDKEEVHRGKRAGKHIILHRDVVLELTCLVSAEISSKSRRLPRLLETLHNG